MYRPSGTGFLPNVPHLFPPGAFDPPAPLAAPVTPSEWTSFNVLDANGPSAFDEFRESPQFEQTRQQILDRVAQCEDFARLHFTETEARRVIENFSLFRENLLNDHRQSVLTGNLHLLYGSGKRHFDSFCLRLAQDDLDLHQRKTALRELAGQLHNCRSGGAAFKTAALALDRSPGGLRGAFYDLVLMRIDAILKEVIKRDESDPSLSSAAQADRRRWLGSMEVHMVNHIKLALDLPGADEDDKIARSPTMCTPQKLLDCQAALRDLLRPSLLAKQLAEDYMTQLREGMPEAARSDEADLSEHMAALNDAHGRLGATFGPVPLDHLLQEDEATGETHWQHDLSLVTTDMLRALQRQNLIVEQPMSSLMRDCSYDCIWDLMQIDWQVFVVQERPTMNSAPALAPVQLRHVQDWMQRIPFMSPVPAITDTLLASRRQADLQNMPPHWLTDEGKCIALCRGLGENGVVSWINRQTDTMANGPLRQLLPVLTERGFRSALAALMKKHPQYSSLHWVNLAGGPGILQKALAQGNRHVHDLWMTRLSGAIPEMDKEDVLKVFTSPSSSQPSALSRMMLANEENAVSNLIALMVRARSASKMSPKEFLRHVAVPIQSAMKKDCLAALQAYGSRILEIAKSGWLSTTELCALMEGAVPEKGYTGALESGMHAVVPWFHSVVNKLAAHCYIGSDQALTLLACTPQGRDSGAMRAIQEGHSRALAAHLEQLQISATKDVVPVHEIPRLLACRDSNGRSGLAHMLLTSTSEHPCLEAWKSAVITASQRHLLTHDEVMDLVDARNADGESMLQQMIRLPNGLERAQVWLRMVNDLVQAKALPPDALVTLLQGRDRMTNVPSDSLLFRALTKGSHPQTLQTLVELYGWAQDQGLFPMDALIRLLLAKRLNGPEGPAIVVAIDNLQTVELETYLEGILALRKQQIVTADTFVSLLDGCHQDQLSALESAVTNRVTLAVQALMETALAAAEQKLISADQWCRILLPHGGDSLWEAVRQCSSTEIRNIIRNALARAEESGLLNGDLGFELLQRSQLVLGDDCPDFVAPQRPIPARRAAPPANRVRPLPPPRHHPFGPRPGPNAPR